MCKNRGNSYTGKSKEEPAPLFPAQAKLKQIHLCPSSRLLVLDEAGVTCHGHRTWSLGGSSTYSDRTAGT